MKQIPNESIKKWAYSSSNKLSHPVSIAAVCPGCSLTVIFNTKRRQYDANRDTSSCSADCPACNTAVHFWVVDMVAHARQDGEGDPGIFMLPSPRQYMQMNEQEDVIPENVLKYCQTAQDIFFSGNLMASNVLIRTAIETIFEDFLPTGNSRGTLSNMIRDSITTINHNEPLAQLSSSTAKQGDLHALFKKHHSTDKPTADGLMELLETLILYLYILPARFRDLEALFQDLNEADARQGEIAAEQALADEARSRRQDPDYDDDTSRAA